MIIARWFTFLFVAGLCKGSQAAAPELSQNQQEIFVNEDEPLELSCTGSKKIKFYFPKDDASISTSEVDLEEHLLDGGHRTILRRKNTVFGDTGWYGCAEDDFEVIAGIYNQSEVSWTYVWVQSNFSYFVQSDSFESIKAAAGEPAVIPCRVTSPEYKVKLVLNDAKQLLSSDDGSYDPKFGFKLERVALKDSGYYSCVVENGETTQELSYHLHVMKLHILKTPSISEHSIKHVTRGQTLHVNCTVNVESDLNYDLKWKTPQRDNRISQHEYREPFKTTNHVSLRTATCELVIDGVTDQDEGEYECTITSYSDRKTIKTFIKVHDPDLRYINLSTESDLNHERKYGERVQWLVNVDAYPQPVLKWLDPKGEVISASWTNPERSKYAVDQQPSSIILRINRLDLSDIGTYTLQATNSEKIETLNFTLGVLAKPIPMLQKLEPFYMVNQMYNFRCEVAAFPSPNISWTFLKVPNYPSYDGSELVHLKNSPALPKRTTFMSETSMDVITSGHLICTACNTLGCDSEENIVHASDVPGGFGILGADTVTVGDDVVRTCAASKYNYTSVEWLDDQNRPVFDNGSVSITKTTTKFTYRSILLIKNISKFENNTVYSCIARYDDGSDDRFEYKLEIQVPSEPHFLETNMNQTEITLDLNTEGHKTVILKCFVEGMPKPVIKWYKDEMQIKTNEQYMCLHDNQELHIKYLLESSKGKYTCRAKNRFGELENSQTITVIVKEISKSLIISIVILVILCILLVIYFSIKIHREKVIRKQLMEAGLTHFEEGALECLNPDLTVDDQAELLPYDRKWEFPREKLKFGKQLGFGAFGVVMKAEAHGISEHEAVSTVAVKMVRRSTDSTYIRALASELKIMVHLGKHLNVVNLLGACTKNIAKRELLVIVEYCRFGNLHDYLLRHRADFIDQIDPNDGKFDPTIGLDILSRTPTVGSNSSISGGSYRANPDSDMLASSTGMDSHGVGSSPDSLVVSNDSTQPHWRSNYHGDYKDQNLKPICTQDLLSWAFQVARGMEYLSHRKVLHGDLAARNILLAENNIVKICDFGLAKTMYKNDNYKKKGDALLPVKWMAIESIRDRIFSTQSDIWSFGIVLWEFFTLAKTPYPGMEAEKQYQRLIEGYRMEQPDYATKQIYDIMLQCWKAKPTLRPSFTSLVSSIGSLLEESIKEHYVDLNAPYLDMNTTIQEGGKNDYLMMMSAPDHDVLFSSSHEYVNSPGGVSGQKQKESCQPSSSYDARKIDIQSDSESEAVEASPMLGSDESHYLKPINIHERRAEFVKKRQALKNAESNGKPEINVANNLSRSRENGIDKNAEKLSKAYVPSIIHGPDNYVNMPRQNELRKDSATSFSNPSYITIDNNLQNEQMSV